MTSDSFYLIRKRAQQGLPCVNKTKNTMKLLEAGDLQPSSEAEHCRVFFFSL